MLKILFVCTGNTCRSPMAEFLMKEIVTEKGLSQLVSVRSAGLAAMPGDRINEQAATVLESNYTIVSDEHRSTAVSPYLLDEQDLILVMTESHAEHIQAVRPDLRERVYTVIEFYLRAYQALFPEHSLPAYTSLSVADPYGLSLSVYEDTAAMLKEYLKVIVDYIEKEML